MATLGRGPCARLCPTVVVSNVLRHCCSPKAAGGVILHPISCYSPILFTYFCNTFWICSWFIFCRYFPCIFFVYLVLSVSVLFLLTFCEYLFFRSCMSCCQICYVRRPYGAYLHLSEQTVKTTSHEIFLCDVLRTCSENSGNWWKNPFTGRIQTINLETVRNRFTS